eukprot:GHVN01064891.1.p2 GENE.GHVN01064891.1~~GHVN01064891.1.p2  ORF type:complete len:171 (-),score=29.38 GHVN01064891.1:171-683(-)
MWFAAAVYAATKEARALVLEKRAPVLLELMTYRLGHHSTSDDSRGYRLDDDVEAWMDEGVKPIGRLKNFFKATGMATTDEFDALSAASRKEIISRINVAEKTCHPPIDEIFTDVYDSVPPFLSEQRQELTDMFNNHKLNPKINVNKYASSPRFPTKGHPDDSLRGKKKGK